MLPNLTSPVFFILFLYICWGNIVDAASTQSPQLSGGSRNKMVPELAPYFRIEKMDNVVEETAGLTATFNCFADGIPSPQVTWLKDGTPVNDLQRHDEYELASPLDQTLILKIVTSEDKGNYTCIARNKIGEVTHSFILKIIDANKDVDDFLPIEKPAVSSPKQRHPYWTRPSRMEKILHAEPAGNTVRFRCYCDGDPKPTITWFKYGKEIDKEDRVSGYKFKNGKQLLVLESVLTSDKGSFTCVIHNKYGSLNHTYDLDVQERSASKPILEVGLPRNTTAIIGENVTFECKVYSDAHPHIQWLKITNSPNNTKSVQVLKTANVNTTNEDMEILKLHNVSAKDAGQYTCLAGNSIGIAHQSAWLTVLTKAPGKSAGMLNGTKWLLISFGALLALVVIIGSMILAYHKYLYGQDEGLIKVTDLDKLPILDKVETPTLMEEDRLMWQMYMANEPYDFKLPPDLQWELKRTDILLLQKLDEGFFGQVFKAELSLPNTDGKEKVLCAVKMLKSSGKEKDVLDLLTEMDQMKRIGKHKNIINLLGVSTQKGPLWLVTEYASEGNLRDYLRRNRPQNMANNRALPGSANHTMDELSEPETITQKDLISYAFQVSRGMDYLAQKKCIHRDLAARNVLVTADRVMKIADFGLARDIRIHQYYRKITRGHLPYKWMALEAMSDNVFTHATDVWSFGVLLWEIFSLGCSPYPGINTNDLVKFLLSGNRCEKPQFASDEMYRLMQDCWDEDSNKRPSFRQLVEDLDKMLTEASSMDYIDLTAPLEGVDSSSGSDMEEEESESDDDSVFEDDRKQYLLKQLQRSYPSESDDYTTRLLSNGSEDPTTSGGPIQSNV